MRGANSRQASLLLSPYSLGLLAELVNSESNDDDDDDDNIAIMIFFFFLDHCFKSFFFLFLFISLSFHIGSAEVLLS